MRTKTNQLQKNKETVSNVKSECWSQEVERIVFSRGGGEMSRGKEADNGH